MLAISAVSTYTPAPSITMVSSQETGGGQGHGSHTGNRGTLSNGHSSDGGYPGSNSGSGGNSGGTVTGMAAAPLITPEAKTEKKSKDKMGDPATKYLRVPSGQEIKLAPDGIIILCSGGIIKIEILKNGKINICAKENIFIMAKNNIKLKAKYVIKADCQKTASLKSVQGGSLFMDDTGKLTFKGTEVHVN